MFSVTNRCVPASFFLNKWMFSTSRPELVFFFLFFILLCFLLKQAKHLAVCHFRALLYISHLWRWVFFRKTDWYISCLFSARWTTNNLLVSLHTLPCALVLEDKLMSDVLPVLLKSVTLLYQLSHIIQAGKHRYARQQYTSVIDNHM